jgi:choline kinase
VKNKKYNVTNMVESLMLCGNKLINGNLIIIYGDIFFDRKIIKKIMRLRGNVIPLNSLWLRSWKKRYRSIKKIKMDAEDVKVSKNNIVTIGGKIGKNLPKYQYMGIIKIDQNSFDKLRKFYKSLNNRNISMTKFINDSINSKIASFKYIKSKDYWFEVDNYEDLKFLKKEIHGLL